jgi:hypothetical protein
MPHQTAFNAATLAQSTGSDNSGEIDTSTLDLLERWRREDATLDPEVIRASEIELEEFMEAMNRNRRNTGERPVYP